MLTQKGRVQLSEDCVVWARSTIEKLGLHEATLTVDVALETSMLSVLHSDPSDRLLAASARVFDLTLVTADERLIAAAPAIRVFANR